MIQLKHNMDFNITQEEILEEIKRIKDEEKIKEIVQNQLKEFYESKNKEIEILKEQNTVFNSIFESLQNQFLELKLELSKKDIIIETLDKRIKTFEDDKENERLKDIERLEKLETIRKESVKISESVLQNNPKVWKQVETTGGLIQPVNHKQLRLTQPNPQNVIIAKGVIVDKSMSHLFPTSN